MARIVLVIALLVGIGAAAFYAVGGEKGVRKEIFAQAMPVTYFEPYADRPAELKQISGNVYAFTYGFSRSLVLDTSEGLAVFDTFHTKFAQTLKAALDERFPSKPIKWVIYSHNHLDHIRGSAVLEAEVVIGHRLVNYFAKDWAHATDIAPVTRPVDGDTVMTLGGIDVEFLYMPHSHSETIYGFHIPSESAVFAADMMFVRAVPPFDFPDFYYPGYVRALDRLIALNADHYVPSHLDEGSRQDLIDFRNMTVAFHETIQAELAKNNYNASQGDKMRAGLKAAYDKLEPEYGDWHGFNEMFVPKFGRHWGGLYLGY